MSALVVFMIPLSWSNWNLEILIFMEGEKPNNPKKNPRSYERTSHKSDHIWQGAIPVPSHLLILRDSGTALSVPVGLQTHSFRLPSNQERFVRYHGSCESKTETSNSRNDKPIVKTLTTMSMNI